MDHDFWQTRWREGRTGFHESAGSPRLQAHLAQLTGEDSGLTPDLTTGVTLVPLCGKTHDLRVLAAAGHQVVGVELVESAAVAFFAEWPLTPTIDEHGPFRRYQGGGVTLLVGDFFALTPELLGPAPRVFDRAALVALPPELRARYAPHLLGLLSPGGRILLVTFEYDQSLSAGPPFSVPGSEVDALFRHECVIEPLSEQVVEATGSSLRALGATLREVAWLLTRS